MQISDLVEVMDIATMKRIMSFAVDEGKQGYSQGGVPVGSVISTEDGEIIARGHNMHHQNGDPTSHGETQCVRNAGRRRDWDQLTLFTTLSPCAMCSGMSILLNFKRVVIGDRKNFQGMEQWLTEAGIEIVHLDDPACHEMMDKMLFERPDLWNEDIGK